MSLSTARNLKFVASFFLKWCSKLFVRCRDHIVITTCIRLLERPQIESLVFFVVPALLAMLSICWLGWEIFANVAYFDGYFANGPFQLLNPLRRLSVGQTVGQDFFVFHGIGLVWLHYPIFDILGRDLFASEISRYTIPAILHLIAAIALGTSFFRTFTVRQGFYAFIFIFFSGAAILQTYTYLPENASLGVRSAVPLFLAAALVHPRPLLLAAPLLAACLIVSVEHGIAAILSLGVAVFACLLNRKTWKKSAFLCLTLLLGTTIAAIVLFLTSNGNLLELVRFSLVDIPTDQFWYFGSSPNLYLYENWQFLLSHVETRRYLLVWSFGWLAVIIFWSKRPEQFIAMTFLMSYATFGVVSQFGYIFYGNLHAPERAGFAVLLLTLFCVPIHAAIRTLATACLLAYLTSWIPYMMRQHYTETLPNQSAYLSNYWKSHIEAVKQVIDGKSLWSTYAGLPESHFGIFHPSPYDYIIHALGPRRRADYLRTFEQVSPDVIRLDNRRSWVYGNWLLKANWPFHRAVFANYDLAHSDEFSTLWTKRQVPVARGSETKTDIALNGCVELELPRGVYTAEMTYNTSDLLGWIPVVDRISRYYVFIANEMRPDRVPVPPPEAYDGFLSFPLIVPVSGPTSICPMTQSVFGSASLAISALSVYKENFDPSTLDYLLREIDVRTPVPIRPLELNAFRRPTLIETPAHKLVVPVPIHSPDGFSDFPKRQKD